jgi:hypothetical protein
MSSGGKIVCLEECKGGAIIDPRSELSILERHEYEKGLREIFNLLTIRGDYQVIGSGAIQEIKYGSDYDLQEFVKESDYKKSTKHLLKMFQEKFRMAAADPDVFILDFKCGVDDDDKPIRWDKKSIKKGYQMVDGRKVTFQECLLMKSTIKMDITALIDGVFIEFSDNYYLTLKDFNTFTAVAKSHEDILYSLQHEAETKYHHGDYWKAMKRIFAYMKSKGGYVPKVKQLVRYFNSATGLLSKNRSELDIIALIIVNKFRKPRLEDVVRNLQLVRQELAKIHGFKLNEVEADLDRISKMPLAKMSKPLEEVIAKVKGMVNAHAKRFLDKHNDITALILDTEKLRGGIRKNIQSDSDSESDEEKVGGSKNSGFVQRMIAEKKVKIKKVKDPSQWLLNNHKTVSAPRTKPNIELVIEEEAPPKKAKTAKAVAKSKVELVIEEDEPPLAAASKAKRMKRVKDIVRKRFDGKVYYTNRFADYPEAFGIVGDKVMVIGEVGDHSQLNLFDEPKPVSENVRFYDDDNKLIKALNDLQGEDAPKKEKKAKAKAELVMDKSDVDFLKSVEKKELKRLMLEWFEKNDLKTRGKIPPTTKAFLAQDGVKLFEDFDTMYTRAKAGQPYLEELPKFRYSDFDKEFTPEKMIEFIKEKLAAESEFEVGKEYLVNTYDGKTLVKVTKVTPSLVTFTFDNRVTDKSYTDRNQNIHSEGHYPRTFKADKSIYGKKPGITNKAHSIGVKRANVYQYDPTPVPKNFNYKWSSVTDMG